MVIRATLGYVVVVRIFVALLGMLVSSSCSEGGPSPSTTDLQEIRSVCAPEVTRSDARFQIVVRGGCDADAQRYSCVVSREGTTVEVRLLGPAPSGDCATVSKPCSVPGLPPGTHLMRFLGGNGLDREVVAAPEHAVFECVVPDAGG